MMITVELRALRAQTPPTPLYCRPAVTEYNVVLVVVSDNAAAASTPSEWQYIVKKIRTCQC